MNHKGTQIIETERLILRPFCEDDAEPMFRNWASDPEVTKFLTWSAYENIETAKQTIGNWVKGNDDPRNYQWAIELKKIHEPIGSISAVKTDDRTEAATIGYCIGRSWWGQGITAEALRAVIDFFFCEVNMNCVNSCHDPRNPNSGKVMKKCGMTYEGTWRAGGVNNQGICDESWYSILKKEYKMREKMHTGDLYLPGDEAIMKEQVVYQDLLCEYNLTKPSETEKRAKMLKTMLGDCGEGVYIEAPFYSNFGGRHCHFGNMVYANYHLTCVDDTHIYVGDYTMIGPNVTIATAGHPILPELREKLYQYNMPVHIGRNCWIGAGAMILPGVTIGDHTVIGAGSVVTKDIPSGVVAVGNPCRVMREINEHDKKYYFKDRAIKPDDLE